MTWAQRLEQVFNIDIQTCCRCGGAAKVIGLVTHFYGFDSGAAKFEERLEASALDELICANTRHGILERIQASPRLSACMTVLDVAPYLAQAIRNYQSGGTVKDMINTLPDLRELYSVVHGQDVP